MRFKSLLPFLLLCMAPAHGDELSVCYNYGCASTATVHFRGAQLLRAKSLFAWANDPATERDAISRAIGIMQIFAGGETPIINDKGGNLADEGINGSMDCIDHTHTTSAFLRLMEERGWLKFHRTLEPVSRPYQLIGTHWAARIAETASEREFIVDAWFFDHGHPAAIFTFEDWMAGAEPAVETTATGGALDFLQRLPAGEEIRVTEWAR